MANGTESVGVLLEPEIERQSEWAKKQLEKLIARAKADNIPPGVLLPILLDYALSSLLRMDMMKSMVQCRPLSFNRTMEFVTNSLNQHISTFRAEYAKGAAAGEQ